MNGAALDTLENSIGGTNPVQGSISPQNIDLVLVNNLPSTSSLSKVVSLSFEMLGWGGGGVTNCHSFLLSNPTLSLSSPLKTMLDDAANDLILNWNCFFVPPTQKLSKQSWHLLGVVKGCCWIYRWHEQWQKWYQWWHQWWWRWWLCWCLPGASKPGRRRGLDVFLPKAPPYICPDLPKTCQPTKTSRQQPNYTFASPCQSGKPW